MANCKFEGCQNDAWHSTLGCCKTCYSGLRYWSKRPLGDKRARLQQVVRLESRMVYLVGGNPLPKAKRKQT